MLFPHDRLKVRRVGPNLVAAFQKANPPLIWSFDLERNHSFTLTLQGEEGDWELGVTSPKGDFYAVTRFMSREDADEAFHGVQKVLMRKPVTILGMGLKFFAGLIGLLVLAALLFFGFAFVGQNHMAQSTNIPQRAVAAAPAEKAKMPEGVPVSADEFLQAPH